MSSLKKIRDRICSVTATRQMTSSMKVVAVSRLKRKYAEFLKTISFADEMNRVMRRLIRSIRERQESLARSGNDTQLSLPILINGNGKDQRYVVVVVTSDDGLSGASSLQILKQAQKTIDYLLEQKKSIHIFMYGARGGEILQRLYPDIPVIVIKQKHYQKVKTYLNAERISVNIIESFHQNRFDVCLIVYNQFKSIVSQVPVVEQIVPNKIFLKDNPWSFLTEKTEAEYVRSDSLGRKKITLKQSQFLSAIGGVDVLPSLQGAIFRSDLSGGKRPPFVYDYEPTDIALLEMMLPQYLTAYIYRVLLETEVSDNAARLMAMDNATRNAGDMLDTLNQLYRRERQTRITTDIAEVSAGSAQGG